MKRNSMASLVSILGVLVFYSVAGAQGLVISGGNVGIGTDSPSQPLDVSGNINTTGNITAAGYISGSDVTVTGGTITGNGSGITNVNAATLNGQTSSDIIAASSAEVRTPISSLPFTIVSSGSYYLTGNLTSTGDGITVNADNVTIDFNGFTITGPGKTSGTGTGIYTAHNNVEIKNGTVSNFGSSGIDASSGTGFRLIHMRIQDNGGYAGITSGGYSYIVDCSISNNTGIGMIAGDGSTVSGNVASYNHDGLMVGNGSTVKGNTASYNTQFGVKAGTGSTVSGNTASNNQFGITANSSSTVKNNTAYLNEYGISLGGNDLVDGNTANSNTTYNMCCCVSPGCALGLNYWP